MYLRDKIAQVFYSVQQFRSYDMTAAKGFADKVMALIEADKAIEDKIKEEDEEREKADGGQFGLGS